MANRKITPGPNGSGVGPSLQSAHVCGGTSCKKATHFHIPKLDEVPSRATLEVPLLFSMLELVEQVTITQRTGQGSETESTRNAMASQVH
jgi:hypothetical protein